MALPLSSSAAPFTFSNVKSSSPRFFFFFNKPIPSFPISVSFPIGASTSTSTSTTLRVVLCRAQTGPVQKSSSSTTNTKKKKKKKKKSSRSNGTDDSNSLNYSDFEIMNDFPDGDAENAPHSSDSSFDDAYHSMPLPLPNPPAGFVVDNHGKVLCASTNRLATIVDPTNNLPLECVIRREFRSSAGDECMLLCPVDTPVQILKSTNVDGWSAISDEEVESILPAAAYALAKIHMHLIYSGYCYTARGGFCYTEEDVFDFHTDDVKEVDGLPTEGVEITYFNLEGAQYMIYTPSDPLFFVAVKDHNGMLQVADDELLEDPAIIDAIDEETEYNALVEEEAALLDTTMGKR